MLRNKTVVSPIADFTDGRFRTVVDDPRFSNDAGAAAGVRKLLLCSGKIYWELAAARDKRKTDNTAIVRIEQLYPLPDDKLAAVLDRYPGARDVRWVQEEPANQGPWPYFGLDCRKSCPNAWPGSSGSPAGGWRRPPRGRRRSTRSNRTTFSTRPSREPGRPYTSALKKERERVRSTTRTW